MNQEEKVLSDSLYIVLWGNFLPMAKKKLVACVSFIIFFLFLFLSIMVPIFSDYGYSEQISPIFLNKDMPPRIPIIEKIGLFDGTRVTDISEAKLSEYDEGEYSVIGEFYIENVFGRKEKRIKIRENTYKIRAMEDKYYWFGTDEFSRDIWTRTWAGVAVSIFIGFFAAFISIIISLIFGVVSVLYDSKSEDFLCSIIKQIVGGVRFVFILLVLIWFGQGILSVSFGISIFLCWNISIYVHRRIIQLKNSDFAEASIALGTGKTKLFTRHILPNIFNDILIVFLFTFSRAIIAEVVLATLGVGITSLDISIGTLLVEYFKFYRFYPFMFLLPLALLVLLIVSLSVFSNFLYYLLKFEE